MQKSIKITSFQRNNYLFLIGIVFIVGTLFDEYCLRVYHFAIGGLGAALAAVVAVVGMLILTKTKPTLSAITTLLRLSKPQIKDRLTKGLIISTFAGIVIILGAEFMHSPHHILTAPLLLYALSAAIIPPVIEELLNRGFIQSSLERMKYSHVTTVSVSTIIFALSHYPVNSEVIPQTLVMGVLFGIITIRTKSVLVPFAMHGVWNFCTTIILH